MQPYYYMVYALRRILGPDGDARDFGEWRAVAFFLLIQVELLVALIAIFAPGLFRQGTAIAWCLGVAIPAVVATYWLLGGQQRYSRYAARFNSWSSGKRAIADVGALVFGVVALAAPFLAKSLVG
jgi:hypothetical protein